MISLEEKEKKVRQFIENLIDGNIVTNIHKFKEQSPDSLHLILNDIITITEKVDVDKDEFSEKIIKKLYQI